MTIPSNREMDIKQMMLELDKRKSFRMRPMTQSIINILF